MTESDDKLSRRYRSLAREEPPPAIDAAILAASKHATKRTPGTDPAKSGSDPGPTRVSRWMGPVSIAAVLVLGIGVTLRMQMEQPGIETSASTPASEYSLPPGAEPAPAPAPEALKPGKPLEVPKSPPLRRAAPAPTADANVASAPGPSPVVAAPVAAPQAPAAAAAPTLSLQSAAPRAKREMASDAAAGTRELRQSVAAQTDPERELERIAKLREAGNHAEAGRALEEFRRRHPGFRIPEAMWERVRER